MKKGLTLLATALITLTLAACGNGDDAASNANQDQATTSSQTVKNNQRSSSSKKVGNDSANQSSSAEQSSNKVMTTQQVVARVAQLKNVNLKGGDKVIVTPTNTPNVFKIYIKGANQDPQVDSLIDHYVYNGNTDVLSQATDR